MDLVALRHVGSSWTQRWDPCSLRWRVDSYPRHHQEGPLPRFSVAAGHLVGLYHSFLVPSHSLGAAVHSAVRRVLCLYLLHLDSNVLKVKCPLHVTSVYVQVPLQGRFLREAALIYGPPGSASGLVCLSAFKNQYRHL